MTCPVVSFDCRRFWSAHHSDIPRPKIDTHSVLLGVGRERVKEAKEIFLSGIEIGPEKVEPKSVIVEVIQR